MTLRGWLVSDRDTVDEKWKILTLLDNPEEFWNFFLEKCYSTKDLTYIMAFIEKHKWNMVVDLWKIIIHVSGHWLIYAWKQDYWNEQSLVDNFLVSLRQEIERIKEDYPQEYAQYVYLYGIRFFDSQDATPYINESANLWNPRAQFDIIVKKVRWYRNIWDLSFMFGDHLRACLENRTEVWDSSDDFWKIPSTESVKLFLNHLRQFPWLLWLPEHYEQIISVCDHIYNTWDDSLKKVTIDSLWEILDSWHKDAREGDTNPDMINWLDKKLLQMQWELLK